MKYKKCLPGEAHHYVVETPKESAKFIWGECKKCEDRRLFKVTMPEKLDWKAIYQERLKLERKLNKDR